MNLPRAYRVYISGIPQWSIRITGGYIYDPSFGNRIIQPTRDSISILKQNITEYLFVRVLGSCPGSYYLLTESNTDAGILISTITNKTSDGFEIINVNPTPI